MGYRETVGEMNGLRMKMLEMRKEIRALQESIEPEDVSDYAFMTEEGEVMLSALFGDKKTLFMVHNMGQSCSYCTQWADGLNGVLGHLEDRAAFVVSSPDLPDKQKAFAGSRGWKFQMVSHNGSSIAEDMGYSMGNGFMPGVSVFQKEGDRISRVSDTQFGPGDDFNAVWNLFDMIPEGPDGWQPKFAY